MNQIEIVPGAVLFPGLLDRALQHRLLAKVIEASFEAPFYRPLMPRTGMPMSVDHTNLGDFGWYTDQANGYRYEPKNPNTGKPWPAIFPELLSLWDERAGYHAPPDAVLVGRFHLRSKLGLHVDDDEQAKDAPILSVSLGDDALFRIGGRRRTDPTQAFKLRSGDVLVLGGPARFLFHGVDRILPATSTLMKSGGRINLTARRVRIPGQGGSDDGASQTLGAAAPKARRGKGPAGSS